MNFHYERDLNLIAAHLTYIDYHETSFFYVLSNEISGYSLSVELVSFQIYLT